MPAAATIGTAKEAGFIGTRLLAYRRFLSWTYAAVSIASFRRRAADATGWGSLAMEYLAPGTHERTGLSDMSAAESRHMYGDSFADQSGSDHLSVGQIEGALMAGTGKSVAVIEWPIDLPPGGSQQIAMIVR